MYPYHHYTLMTWLFSSVAIYSIFTASSSNLTIGGMNYSITCIVSVSESTVPLNVTWIGPYGAVTNSSNAVTLVQSTAGTEERNVTLLFNPLLTSHGGRYTCVSMVTTPAVTNVTATKDIKIQSIYE